MIGILYVTAFEFIVVGGNIAKSMGLNLSRKSVLWII